MPDGQTIVFDLDGTLTNPRKGIVRSINFALGGLGQKPLPEAALTRFIGPPLKEIFSELLCTGDEDTLTKAIHLFRQRYFDVGYRENRLYDGIPSLLSTLKGDGNPLYIATTKREDIARKVAGHFGIAGYFNGIFGCDLDTPKAEILWTIMKLNSAKKSPAFMIGDRGSDMAAGAEAGLRLIGVRWGFGAPSELLPAEVVVNTPTELLNYLRHSRQN